MSGRPVFIGKVDKGQCKIKSGVRPSPRLPLRSPIATEHRRRRCTGVRSPVIHVARVSCPWCRSPAFRLGVSFGAAILAAEHCPQAKCPSPGCSSALTFAPYPYPPIPGSRRQKAELVLAQTLRALSILICRRERALTTFPTKTGTSLPVSAGHWLGGLAALFYNSALVRLIPGCRDQARCNRHRRSTA